MWCKWFWLLCNIFHKRIPQYTEVLHLVHIDYLNSNYKSNDKIQTAYCRNTTCCDGPFFQKCRLGLSHEIKRVILFYFKGHGREICECNPHCHVWQSAPMWTKLSKDVRRLSSVHHVFCVREMLLINLSPGATEWSDGRRWQIKTHQTSQRVEPSRVCSTHKITHMSSDQRPLCVHFPSSQTSALLPSQFDKSIRDPLQRLYEEQPHFPPSRHW